MNQKENDIYYSKIIQADFSQSHPKFGDLAGNQCTGIVIYALAYSSILPCINWQPGTLNIILNEGNEYYNFCRRRNRIQSIHLSCEDALGMISINNIFTYVQLYPQFQNSLSMSSIDDTLSFFNLSRHLRIFYISQCSYAVLIANGYTYGIIKQFDMIYFFDSHAKDIHGNPSKDGKASLRLFDDLDSLVNFIRFIFNFQEDDYFQLTYLDISKTFRTHYRM